MKVPANMIKYSIILATIAISISLLFYGKKLIDNLNQLRISEVELFTESRSLDQNFSEFQRALGFGGYIHNVKEYLLHRNQFQLDILEANINDLDNSYKYLKEYFRDNETNIALESLDSFMKTIHESYNTLLLPENLNLESSELDNLLKLETSETLSSLITLETFKDNYNRRAISKIKSSIDKLVSNLLLASILLPLIILVGIYLTYLLNKSYKSSQELEAARRLLIESEERLEATSRTARVGGWEIKSAQSDVRWTKETFHIFGIPFKKTLSLKEALGFYSQKNQEIFISKIDEAFQNASPFQLELPYQNTNGDNGFVHIICTPITDDDTVVKLLGTIQEVTVRKSLEEQLLQSQKMDSIGQLAGGMAHDFNNVLAGIMNAAQLLQSPKRNLDEKGLKYTNMILQASEQAAELIDKLLVFGRKGKNKSATVDVHKIIDDTVSILNNTIDKKITISVNKYCQNNKVIGDNSSLQNALLNLCINASHAMPDGGDIKITTTDITLNKAYCDTSTFDLTPGEYCEIEVLDTGTGIPDKEISHIFEPFYTTKEQGKGTGLGLSTVYGTIRDHHGSITVYSEYGSGTTFHILLPCSEKHFEAKKISKEVPSGSGLILLVDDEEIIQITGKLMLEEFGYTVLVAKNGHDAIDIFQKQFNEIDLVIMDMIMPKANGREVFYKMKEIDNNCKVVLSSGFTRNENINELKKSGLLGFLRKPFRDYELGQLLAEILNK